jgi:transcriptional regulator GlxA family with amidase domain
MNEARDLPGSGGIRRFHFALLDRFTLLSFSCAVETLRIANRISGRTLYTWRLVGEHGGEHGGEVACSAGARFPLDGALQDVDRDDTICLCGGLDIARAATRPLLSWIRKADRRGARIGGLCTASWIMAEAGLLDGRRATIHWENNDGFVERFPEVTLTKSVFTDEGRYFTTAGGTSSIDLMLKIIADDHGDDLANEVADQLIYSSIRTDQDVQRLSMPSRIGVRHPRLAQVIQMMEAHIEDPISPAVLASEVGLSARQLERLFRRYLGRSPKRYYMQLRLQKARSLLLQTDMSVIAVAMACGFTSPSHFSKCYRGQYATTPYRERGVHSGRVPV